MIELMIVLAILAVIAAMVVPNLQRSFDRNEVQEAARQLQEQIGELQREASESGAPILVQLSLESHHLKVSRLPLARKSEVQPMSEKSSDSRSGLEQLSGLEINESLWQTEEIELLTEVRFQATPSDNSPSDNATADNATVADSSTGSEFAWSVPIVVDGRGFQKDHLFWLNSGKWQAAVFFRSISGRVEIGSIRFVDDATPPQEDRPSTPSGSSERSSASNFRNGQEAL